MSKHSGRLFAVKVRGASMQPALRPGDLVVVSSRRRIDAAVWRPVVARGDVVVVRAAGVEAIKRAVAVAGDRYRGATIPDGQVFVVGDYAASSTDSRVWGPIPQEQIIGVARAVYWPPRRWKLL